MDTIKTVTISLTALAMFGCEWVTYEGDEVTYLRTPVVRDYTFSSLHGLICYNADEEWRDDPTNPGRSNAFGTVLWSMGV